MPTVVDIDVRDLEKITPEESERNYKALMTEANTLPYLQRVSWKTELTGARWEILPAYDGCYVDKRGRPIPEIGIFGLIAMTIALPYYAAREALVSLRRRLG